MESEINEHKNILLIDDNDIDLFVAEKIIRYSAFENTITIISSISKSILFLENALKQNKNIPSLIFLDIVMPENDAFYFIEKFNQLFSNTKVKPSIFILTASIDPKQKKNLLNFNAVIGYIEKPLSTQYLNHYLLLNSCQES